MAKEQRTLPLDNERLERIKHVVEELKARTLELAKLEVATAAKRAEVVKLRQELSGLASYAHGRAAALGERANNGERRDQILALWREGLDRKQMRERTGLPSHVVNAALRRLRAAGLIPDHQTKKKGLKQ